jgi:hypothetical protein
MDNTSMMVSGSFFITGAVLLWLCKILLPVPIEYGYERNDFPRIKKCFYRWIWLYRGHIFGCIISAMALVSFGILIVESAYRILMVPALAVSFIGLIISALAEAYYYHFGAFGSLELDGKSDTDVDVFIQQLHTGLEYISCLVRFSRVFFGLGQCVLAAGLLMGNILPVWFIGYTFLVGAAAILLTMIAPDKLHLYKPVFHLNALWLLFTGVVILSGIMKA